MTPNRKNSMNKQERAVAMLAGCLGAGFLPTSLPRIAGFLGIYGSLLVLFRVVSREDFRWAKGLILTKSGR